ncbi:response regulator [Lacrimispora sp. 210928-DFI.3.58]|uniref:response regulator n=1 Tax=Lacrimispora sp. 210928-DFI.3.58 TaxID=2883214 RepID=UPI0015B618EE|nr:response regulator [Lacrimispora sp. 210928-DFI.3.58]MCB7318341.1 response regulator [Lacrimispora sp. 210928-DFI.3.58]
MIKLMIVDDEPVIRKGIVTVVDWKALDIQVVAEAANGRDGLSRALLEKPDIVITDIKMPIMDGITFSSELRKKLPKVRIVFLTGYSDFEYSRHAIRIGAEDYLLKPVNTGELIELMERLKQEIVRENTHRQSRSRENVILKESQPLMRKRLLKQLFEGQVGLEEFCGKAVPLNLPTEGPEFVIIIAGIDYYYQMKANGEKETGLLKYALSNIGEELLGKVGTARACEDQESQILFLLNTKASIKEIVRSCREIQFNMRKFYGLSVSLGIGQKVSELQGLAGSYKQAVEAIESKIKEGSSQIIIHQEDQEQRMESPLFLTADEEKSIQEALALLNRSRCYDLIEEAFEKYVRDQHVKRQQVERLCMYLILIAVRELERLSLSAGEILGADLHYEREMNRYETAEEMELWIKGIYDKCIDGINDCRGNKYKSIVANGIEYMKEHYRDNILVADVAQAVYVTPNYFSKIFKEETGQSFTDWMNHYRIEKAKKRMEQEPETKIYTIAEESGFKDYKYFAFIFKKITGYTPTSYRDLNV